MRRNRSHDFTVPHNSRPYYTKLFFSGEACGPYGHDIHLREICAAWKRPPVTEMTRQEYESWLRVEQQVKMTQIN